MATATQFVAPTAMTAVATQASLKETKITPPGAGGTPSTVTSSGETTSASSQGIVARIVSFFESIPLIGCILKKIFVWIHLHPKEVETALNATSAVIKETAPVGQLGDEIKQVTDDMLDHAIRVIEKFAETQTSSVQDDGQSTTITIVRGPANKAAEESKKKTIPHLESLTRLAATITQLSTSQNTQIAK